jgi:hypothetical protein
MPFLFSSIIPEHRYHVNQQKSIHFLKCFLDRRSRRLNRKSSGGEISKQIVF